MMSECWIDQRSEITDYVKICVHHMSSEVRLRLKTGEKSTSSV